MTDVLVFHHAQGLTDGVRAFAARLRAAGHQVTVPDLYDGMTFATLDEGLAHVEQIGYGTVVERGLAAADAVPEDAVYVGFSLGVLPAQLLAQTRSGARGAVLCHSCVPAAEFGGPWPAGVPLQVHAMRDDELFVSEGDLEAAEELVASVKGAELFLYPGDEHLFSDSSLPGHDPAAAALLLERALGLIDRAGRAASG